MGVAEVSLLRIYNICVQQPASKAILRRSARSIPMFRADAPTIHLKNRRTFALFTTTVTRLHAQTDQQFSQVGNRLEQVEATTGQQRDKIQQQAGRMGLLETELSTRIGQLATQVAGEESTWQERAIATEQEARQLRRDLDAQGRLQQALQKQLDEERKAREELARQVDKLLKSGQQKG